MRSIYFISLFIIPFIFSCTQEYIPKPIGYFRIDLPEKKYQQFEGECPFTFEYPVYARVNKSDQGNAEPCWFNVEFPQFNAKVHLSYKNVSGKINDIIEECRTLAYKHSIKADAIDENPVRKNHYQQSYHPVQQKKSQPSLLGEWLGKVFFLFRQEKYPWYTCKNNPGIYTFQNIL